MRTWVLSLFCLTACNGWPPPPPPPTPPPPTPTPTPPPSTEMLLRTSGTKFVYHSDAATEADIRMIVFCWPPDGEEPEWGYEWPGVGKGEIDFAVEHKFTAVQDRLGPYLARTEPHSLQVLPHVARVYEKFGGPYMEVDGKADLDRWNQPWWDHRREVHLYARSKGVWMLKDLIDGWRRRHPEIPHPWMAEHNLQGEDHFSSIGVELTSRHLAFVDKAEETFGDLDNTFWVEGNEIGIGPYDAEKWSFRMRRYMRERELARDHPVHVFGSNGRLESMAGPVDFAVVHDTYPSGPIANKPTLDTEYNRDPAFTADEVLRLKCRAEALGVYFALWRGGMEEFVEAASRWDEPCPSGCPPPVPNRDSMKFVFHHFGVRWDTTYTTHQQCAYCASIGMGSMPDGSIRCGCPIRPEGHPDRPHCEAEFIGLQQWWCDGVPIEPEPNRAQAVCHGRARTCTEDGRACSQATW